MLWVILIVLALLLLLAAGIAWLRTHPSPLPYSQRLFVQGPHPGLGRERLREALGPEPGERILEIGPGVGYHSLPVAESIGPDGRLELVDVIEEWLEHTARAAEEQGLGNIGTTRADASSLPYEDHSFDAAFLVQVLGEVADEHAALTELRRVLKPGGRLVVGECVLDPHFVTRRQLGRRASEAGFGVENVVGRRLAYFARLRPVSA